MFTLFTKAYNNNQEKYHSSGMDYQSLKIFKNNLKLTHFPNIIAKRNSVISTALVSIFGMELELAL